jgi:PKD repeat protein
VVCVTSKSLRWIVAGILILLVLVFPASAATTRTVINPGATVFVGEQGLDVSPVMGGWTRIAWWAPGNANFPNSPSYSMEIIPGDFTVDPAIFSGRLGNWYAYDTIESVADADHYFYVMDPTLDLEVWEWTGPTDVTGKAVTRGTPLGFRIISDLYWIADGNRENSAGDVDQNVRIIVKDPSNAQYTTLLDDTATAVPLDGQYVYAMPFYWSDGVGTATWDTGALTGPNPAYDAGTYVVWAEADLNGMIDNYNVTGATRSPVYTVTLLSGGEVTITAAGDQSYYFGERIRFSGTNTDTTSTYLFIRGPGLPAQGARLSADPKNTPVINGSPSSFSVADVQADDTWEWDWNTFEDIPLDAGTYTVYASGYPLDYDHVAMEYYATISIVLRVPFITATVDQSTGPVGTVFHFSGTKEGGASPDYYVYITMTNNTPPTLTGSLPLSGVKPDYLATSSVTGVDATFVQATVQADRSWSYDWDTSSGATGGGLLPGSLYGFVVENRPYDIEDAFALPYPRPPGDYNRASYTKLRIGIEGPVTADFTYNNSNGLTVEFTDTSTGVPTNVFINFSVSDPTMFADVTPGGSVTYTYPSPGTYTVRLTAWNSVGSDSETKTITVTTTTREKATAAVINAVFPGGVVPAGKSVYTSLQPVQAGFKVEGWSSSFTPQYSGWFILIDDDNEANWEHPVRWVQQADGMEPVITFHTSPPKNVAVTRTAGDPPVIGGTNDMSSGYSGGNTGYGGGSASCENIECEHCYALLVSGGHSPLYNYNRYWDDISAMYRTLRQTYCYPKENIYVLMSDGFDTTDATGKDRRTGETTYDSSPLDLDGYDGDDIYGPAYKSTLVQTVNTLKQVLAQNPGSDLFIFTTNHGGQDPDGSGKVRLWLWGTGEEQYIWDNDFVALLADIDARSITMTMEQCYSGGFVDDFMDSPPPGQTRVISTAASDAQPSYGNDFSFYWIDGMVGAANYASTSDSDATFLSLREGFLYGEAKDPSHAVGKEDPQYGSTGAADDEGAFFGLSSCAMCPEPDPINGVAPLDPDGDGIYEDMNGDGTLSVEGDALLFFTELEWMKTNEPACAFDLNGNKRVDFMDIVMLYAEVQ